MVARLEIGGKTQLLSGVFPANRQNQFLRDSFDVLDSDTLVRKPAPPQEAKKKEQVDLLDLAAGIDQLTPRMPDLLTESSSGQPPCIIIELPRQKRCYVISAGKHLPLSRAQFLSSRQDLLNALIRNQHTQLMQYWWSSDGIRSRTGYRDPQAPQDASLTDQPPNQSSDEDSL